MKTERTRKLWKFFTRMIGVMLVASVTGVARGDLLYHLPFQDAAGAATLDNFGTVGGTATTGTGFYTNDTPVDVGEEFASAILDNNARITLPDSRTRLTLTNAGDRITGMAWVKLAGVKTVQGVMNSVGTGLLDGWTFNLRNDRKLTFQLGYGGGYIQRQSSVKAPTNEWTHLAFTFTVGNPSSDLKLYMNAESISHAGGELENVVADNNPNADVRVGSRDVAGWNLYGNIDEARLYDEILTPQQIHDIMDPPKGTVVLIE